MKIALLGYLSKSRLDKEGEKHLEFVFSARYAIDIAKLELMARDLDEHLPVLLKVTVEGVNGEKTEKTGRGQASKIQVSRRTPKQNKRVF